jgi:hypothetical protein
VLASLAVNDTTARRRLSPAAIRGFLQLARVWDLTVDEQLDLLGASIGRSTLRNWAADPRAVLSTDQLMRVSYLLGIYEGLQRIWRRAPHEADAWMRRPNPDAPFRGATPLAWMRAGGIPGLAMVRAYVEGATGGPPSRSDMRRDDAPAATATMRLAE